MIWNVTLSGAMPQPICMSLGMPISLRKLRRPRCHGFAPVGANLASVTIWGNTIVSVQTQITLEDAVEGNVFAIGVAFNVGASGNTLAGNFIGTNSTGLTRMLKAQGVDVTSGAGSGNTIGGATAASRNVIASNVDGVTINATIQPFPITTSGLMPAGMQPSPRRASSRYPFA